MQEKKIVHPYAITSFVLAVLCVIPAINTILAPLSLIFGIISFKEIERETKYKGKGLSIASIAISIIVILSVIMYFFVCYHLFGLNSSDFPWVVCANQP